MNAEPPMRLRCRSRLFRLIGVRKSTAGRLYTRAKITLRVLDSTTQAAPKAKAAMHSTISQAPLNSRERTTMAAASIVTPPIEPMISVFPLPASASRTTVSTRGRRTRSINGQAQLMAPTIVIAIGSSRSRSGGVIARTTMITNRNIPYDQSVTR